MAEAESGEVISQLPVPPRTLSPWKLNLIKQIRSFIHPTQFCRFGALTKLELTSYLGPESLQAFTLPSVKCLVLAKCILPASFLDRLLHGLPGLAFLTIASSLHIAGEQLSLREAGSRLRSFARPFLWPYMLFFLFLSQS
jgi:hypothetical protein